MEKKVINTPNAPMPIGPYSQATLAGDTLYISGQICLAPDGQHLMNHDIKQETTQCMDNLYAILQAAGMDFSHVLKTTIFLTDMNRFADVNAVYGEYFQSSFPARETVQVSALPKFVNVEISMIAAK